MGKKTLRLCLALTMLLYPSWAVSIENDMLTEAFEEYEAKIAAYVTAYSADDWESAMSNAVNLRALSQRLNGLARQDKNSLWESYSSNLYHHSLELIQASERKDPIASTYLVAIHLSHLQEIQSANPRWLREYVTENIRIMERSIALRDQQAVRDAAEIVHASAIKILMSVGAGEEVYVHTRWLATITQVNSLGDEILGEVNQGRWDKIQDKVKHIKYIIAKWTDSFVPIPGAR